MPLYCPAGHALTRNGAGGFSCETCDAALRRHFADKNVVVDVPKGKKAAAPRKKGAGPKTQSIDRFKLEADAIPEDEIQSRCANRLMRAKYLTVRMNSGAFKDGGKFYQFYRIFGIYHRYAGSGLPDLIAFKKDRFVMIEVKAKDGKLRPSQERFKLFAEQFGVTILVADNWVLVEELIDSIVKQEEREAATIQHLKDEVARLKKIVGEP